MIRGLQNRDYLGLMILVTNIKFLLLIDLLLIDNQLICGFFTNDHS